MWETSLFAGVSLIYLLLSLWESGANWRLPYSRSLLTHTHSDILLPLFLCWPVCNVILYKVITIAKTYNVIVHSDYEQIRATLKFNCMVQSYQ